VSILLRALVAADDRANAGSSLTVEVPELAALILAASMPCKCIVHNAGIVRGIQRKTWCQRMSRALGLFTHRGFALIHLTRFEYLHEHSYSVVV